jgi:hypothetical protein
MERWGETEDSYSKTISEEQIEQKFQLLKDDGKGNHNLLKSRACEKCKNTGKRGTPMGIGFWYKGGPDWPDEVPETGREAEKGCVGCGWYNFEEWRTELNSVIEDHTDFDVELDLNSISLSTHTTDEQKALGDFNEE